MKLLKSGLRSRKGGKMARLDEGEKEKLRNELLESLDHAERSYGLIPVYALTGDEKEAQDRVKPEAMEVTGLDAEHLRIMIGDEKLRELEQEASKLIGGRYAELKREESALLAVLDDGKKRLRQQEEELLRSRLEELEESTDKLMRQFEGGTPEMRASLEAQKARLEREVAGDLRRKLAELEGETSSLTRHMRREFREAVNSGIGHETGTTAPSVDLAVEHRVILTDFPGANKESKPELEAGSLEKPVLEVSAKAGFDGMLGRLFSHAGSTVSRGEIYEVSNKLEKLFANVAHAQIELGLQRDLIARAAEREGRMLESISELRSLVLRNELTLMAIKAKIGGRDA